MEANKTLRYVGLSIKTLPKLQTALQDILEKEGKTRVIGIHGIYIDDSKYVGREEAHEYVFLKVTVAAANYIVNNAPDTILDSYPDKKDKKNMILVVKPKIDNPDWKYEFMQGNYSKMYPKKILDQLKVKGVKEFERCRNSVLLKDINYWPEFQQQLHEMYGVELEEYDDRELDLPPRMKDEIINYK